MQDYVAAPYLLIRSPFAYVTCLQPSSLRLRRATLILKPLASRIRFDLLHPDPRYGPSNEARNCYEFY